MKATERYQEAFETKDIRRFMQLIFPNEWAGIAARIIETGATITEDCDWAPRWSKIPMTVRGPEGFERHVRSCIFRAHDCLHQLWGLPIPSSNYTEEERRVYKRSQISGEIAVLTLAEFYLCKYMLDRDPEIGDIILKREAVNIMNSVFVGKTPIQVVNRIDLMLHKKFQEKWMDNEHATKFRNYYIPMLELDRKNCDNNWNLMVSNNWLPTGAPNSRYSKDLNGQELTNWLFEDFYHLMNTDSEIDEDLTKFNRSRRENIVLPIGWNSVME